MSIVSMNQMAVKGLELVRASLPGNNANDGKKESAAQYSQGDFVELSKKAVELSKNAVTEAWLIEIADTDQGQDQAQSIDALIDALA